MKEFSCLNSDEIKKDFNNMMTATNDEYNISVKRISEIKKSFRNNPDITFRNFNKSIAYRSISPGCI